MSVATPSTKPLETTTVTALEIHDMTVAYHRKPVLWDIDLVVPEGNLVGIVGPNGAGKTTLIKAVLGLLPLASGKVEIYGKPYDEQRHLIGYVPQRESVDWDFPVTVEDVVLMGTYGHLGWCRRPGRAEREVAARCLEQVGLTKFAKRQIRQLSGGQQQRVFLARALAQDAKVYFMDEPFSGVDAATEAAIIELLQQLRSERKTVFVVHHDLQTVRSYFDYVILLNMRLVACGPTNTTFTNANLHETYGGRLTILDEAAEAVRQARANSMIGQSVTFNVMLGTALLGATAGTIGTFAVLRRRALVGDMLSHAALPGICMAFMLLGSRNLVGLSLGALATGLVGIGVVTVITRWTRTKEDAAIGIVLSTFFGAGVVLLTVVQRSATGNQAGLDKFLFGETAGMRSSDIQMLIATAVFALIVVVALYKEFQLLSFDVDFATSQGWPTLALDLVMMGTLAVVTVVGLPIVGVILMAAMIILPGAGARFWTHHLGTMLIIAGLAGAAAGVLGTLLASPLPAQWLGTSPQEFGLSRRSIPPGPLIVLTAAAFFLASLLFAPEQGVVAHAIAELRLRLRISREHLLRALYELSEPSLPNRPKISKSQLVAHRTWDGRWLNWWLGRAEANGLVVRNDHSVQLTPAGLKAAAEVTRTHRLWELYLVTNAGIAADHVDRDADDVEHMLPAPLINELEERLTTEGKLPMLVAEVPESPHHLSTE